jgi:DNA-directed RNA polymerase specialized sigma24 family protein
VEKNRLAGPVTQLAPLERFVFVMSVLEGHSPAECSALLGCSMQEVVAARSQAMRQLASYQALQLESNGMPQATLMVAAGAA